jgi:hypothetical protein
MHRRWALPLAGALALSPAALACGGDDDDSGDGGDGGGGAPAEVSDALGDEVRTTLATMLYENEGSRAQLEAEAEAEDPELWAEVDADGEVTLEEFRQIPAVQDAVNAYGEDVLAAVEDDLAG